MTATFKSLRTAQPAKVEKLGIDLVVGDVIWFSGFWMTITHIALNRIYGVREGHTPIVNSHNPHGIWLASVKYGESLGSPFTVKTQF